MYGRLTCMWVSLFGANVDTLWLCQNSFGKWPLKLWVFPFKSGDVPWLCLRVGEVHIPSYHYNPSFENYNDSQHIPSDTQDYKRKSDVWTIILVFPLYLGCHYGIWKHFGMVSTKRPRGFIIDTQGTHGDPGPAAVPAAPGWVLRPAHDAHAGHCGCCNLADAESNGKTTRTCGIS